MGHSIRYSPNWLANWQGPSGKKPEPPEPTQPADSVIEAALVLLRDDDDVRQAVAALLADDIAQRINARRPGAIRRASEMMEAAR